MHSIIHLFARNCAECSLIIKLIHWRTQQKTFLNFVIDNPPHLKYATTVPCNLSLITALVGDCRSFSVIIVLQGSVATHKRCSGIFSKYFAATLLDNLSVKNFKNRLIINRVTAMSLVSFFFGTQCIGILVAVSATERYKL